MVVWLPNVFEEWQVRVQRSIPPPKVAQNLGELAETAQTFPSKKKMTTKVEGRLHPRRKRQDWVINFNFMNFRLLNLSHDGLYFLDANAQEAFRLPSKRVKPTAMILSFDAPLNSQKGQVGIHNS